MSPTTDNPKVRWRNFQAATTTQQPRTALPIGVFGSFTVEPLVPWLGGQLLDTGLDLAPAITVGPFNQIFQTCMNPQQAFGGEVEAVVMLWRLEDLFGDLLAAAMAGRQDAATRLHDELQKLLAAVATLRDRHPGTLIVATPPYPATPEFDPQDTLISGAGMRLYTALTEAWQEGLQNLANVLTLNLHELLMTDGYDASHDHRKWYLYRQPYKEVFWCSMGAHLTRLLAAQRRSARKCIVLDCDNTLWGGIVGEDGLAGIAIGEDFPGLAFRDFQRYLLHLQQQGVLLAVASKNNPEDVFEVFDKHDAMVLRREHISVFEVHWNSKADSLRNIAQALNFGTDALVFVDDNDKELAEVSERMPEVECCRVPDDISALPQLLSRSGLFDTTNVTDEDKRRTEMIRVDQARQASQGTLSEAEFLQSLELKIDVFSVATEHVARVTQLINKTNQFNLTTVRRTRDEVEALMARDDALLLAMTVGDRFGDYGLVGVAIACAGEAGSWDIDTLLMSCRVLGRGAETAFLAKLGEAVARQGGTRLRGRYLETRKNVLVKDLYKEHGFAPADATAQDWRIAIDELPQPDDFVTVTLRLA